MVNRPCSCPYCAPIDAGPPDATLCLPQPCPLVKCAPGSVPTFDQCGCTVCGLPDAGADAGKLACVGLDECACLASPDCAYIAEPACYCPQCTPQTCKCAGGKYVGCAPAGLQTCAAAKSRVAGMCPQLAGASLDALCSATDSLCVTKCLNEVTACGDITCSLCQACDCASDAFMRCRGECQKALGL
jgi:hypothetical protein